VRGDSNTIVPELRVDGLARMISLARSGLLARASVTTVR
jgi:hypothetical protein